MNTNNNYRLPKDFNLKEAESDGEKLMRLVKWSKNKKIFGRGSSRKIYQVSDKMIVKVAWNKVGFLQNAKEHEIYNAAPTEHKGRLAKVYSISENAEIMLMELVDTYIPFVHNEGNINECNYISKSQQDDLDKMYNTLEYLNNEFDVFYNDLMKVDAFGMADNQLIYVDYGLTEDVFMSHYGD